MQQNIQIREMKIEDYPQVHALWMTIRGFGIRSIDDSKEGVERFLRRNPDTSVVAECSGRIVGTILCGHDGRRGCFYHVCVHEDYRKQGIGKAMAVFAMKALQKEQINKVSLIAFKENNYLNIAIYGMGYIGECLYDELKGSGIQVKYGIDRTARDFKGELPIYQIEDELERVDMIVVTVMENTKNIIDKLKRDGEYPVMAISELLIALGDNYTNGEYYDS